MTGIDRTGGHLINHFHRKKFLKRVKFLDVHVFNIAIVQNTEAKLSLYVTERKVCLNFLFLFSLLQGLKKLGYSIENSYSDIQKLVVCQLQR